MKYIGHSTLRNYTTIFVISFLFFYEFGLNNLFNVLSPYLVTALKISSVKVSVISSIFFYMELALLIPSGIILDRFSPKNIIVLVICISALGVILTASAHTISTLILGRIFMGIGGTFSFIGCIRIAVNVLPPSQLAKGIGLIVSMGLLGGMAVQMPLMLLINTTGWQNALYILSGLGFFIAFSIYMYIENAPNKLKESSKHTKLSIKSQFKSACLNKQNILCGTYNSLMNLPIFILGAMWGVTYLTMNLNFTNLQASTICSMLFLGVMIGSPLAGILSDSLKRRVLPMKIGSALSIIVMAILILIPFHNFYYELIMFLVLGLITSTQNLSYPTVVESNSTHISSSATSIISLLCMLGGAISQPLFGLISTILQKHYSITTAYTWSVSILLFSFVVSYIICFFIRETYCIPSE